MRQLSISISRGEARCLRCHRVMSSRLVAELIAFIRAHECKVPASAQAQIASIR